MAADHVIQPGGLPVGDPWPTCWVALRCGTLQLYISISGFCSPNIAVQGLNAYGPHCRL